MPRERTDEAAYRIPRPIPEIVATFLVDADHPLCVRARSATRVQQFCRGEGFEMILAVMRNDPHLQVHTCVVLFGFTTEKLHIYTHVLYMYRLQQTNCLCLL